jgi:hypothetical protein
MLINRISQVSGKEHVMDIDVTFAQMREWNNGTLIQDAMPNLSDDEREFLMTGITPQEWEELFGE